VFHGVVEIDDLDAILEIEFAHIFQPMGSVDKQHHPARVAHPPPQGLLAQQRAKLVDGLEARKVGG